MQSQSANNNQYLDSIRPISSQSAETSHQSNIQSADVSQSRSATIGGIKDTSAQDRPRNAVRKNRDSKLIYIVASILLIILISFFVSKASNLLSADQTALRKNLQLATVTRGSLQRDIAVQGRIVAANSPTLYTPATGTVSFKVKAGKTVTKGELLANIESPELNSQLEQQKAQLEELQLEYQRQQIQVKSSLLDNQQQIEMAKVDLALAQKNIERASLNIDLKVISQVEYETQQAELAKIKLQHKHAIENAKLQNENFEFELAAKKLQLDRQQFVVTELKRQVESLSIVSPLDGVVGNLVVNEKDTVGANSPLLTLVDLSAYEVDLNIPESYADDLGVDLAVELLIDNNKYAAQLIAISPEVTNGQVQARAKFVDDIPAGIRQNQRITARVIIATKANVLKVSRGSFVESGGAKIAFKIDGDTATKVPVELGVSSVNEIEVISGLSVDDEIIISDLAAFLQSEKIYLSN